MKLGDRVRVTALWSCFHTMQGRVVQLLPHLMIIIDHDVHPIRVGAHEVEVVDP